MQENSYNYHTFVTVIKTMKRHLVSILRIAVAALFLSYYSGSMLFTHTHSFEWGRVTHSHPYMPGAAHSHTAAGCQLIEHLGHMLFIASATMVLAVAVQVTYRIVAETATVLALAQLYTRPARAPPIC